MIIFVLVVQNNDLETLIFSEVAVHKTLYVFIHARDCSQALQVVQTFKPDCFLIGKNFPTISGLEFATALHTQPRMEQIPTIIFDASRMVATLEQKTLDETLPTILYMKILLEIIDTLLSSQGQISLNAFSMN